MSTITRPADTRDSPSKEFPHAILSRLSGLGIGFEIYEHPPVSTCEEARQHLAHVGGMPTKNLFLRNKKGDRHFLVSVPEEKQVRLDSLSELLESGRLSFASSERLQKHLGVAPGSVTLLGLIADTARAVQVVIDKQIWEAPLLQCHPLVNTATLVISQEGMRKFLASLGAQPTILDVPA